MSRFTATLREGEETLVSDVIVYVEEATDQAGIRSWYGAFQVSLDTHVEPGGLLRIELDDGRGGDILITNITISTHAPTQVSFLGTGPLA